MRLLSTPHPCCAVAFWGRDAKHYFSGGSARIICNLGTGGTNPYEIQHLVEQGHSVRQNDRLHAKVYIGGGSAVVGSANASANGLGLEDVQQARRIEAAILIEDAAAISDWFERLWSDPQTREVDKNDISAAIAIWEVRRSITPQVAFRDFDPNADRVPLLDGWEPTGEKEINEEHFEKETGMRGEEARAKVDDAIEIKGKQDRKLLVPGTWVLSWRRLNKSAMPSKTGGLYWHRCGIIVEKAFRFKPNEERIDIVLRDDARVPPPFDIHEPRFEIAFKDVLCRPKFDQLRDLVENQHSKTASLTREFWREVKARYLETDHAKAISSSD
jgi:hypothetical protein